MGYLTVTEMPGNKATKENIEMLYTRYKWASQFVQGKDILEVACGAGQGLGYLAQKAKRVIGGDIDDDTVKCAQNYYKGKIEILKLDAHNLPFGENSFDVIILFEAIYYLKEPEKFLSECQRILRKNGIVLLCSINKDWPEFNPSPFSFKYFSVPELANLFGRYNFKVEIFGAFEFLSGSFLSKILSLIRKIAVRFHLIPKTMKGKAKLKRIFYGKLLETPSEIKEGMAEYYKPNPISLEAPNHQYKVLYLLAQKK